MYCRFRNRECEHAGFLTIQCIKDYDGFDGVVHKTVCYNDAIGRRFWECKLE